MKKIILAVAILLAGTICHSQEISFSPALSATGYTFFTNDEQHPTAIQRINWYSCLVGGNIYTPALHISTTPVSIPGFTFQLGYSYTLQIEGTATATGRLSQPPSFIAFEAAIGQPQTTTNLQTAVSPFPSASGILAYPGSVPLFCWDYNTTDDLLGTFLTGFATSCTIGNNPTGGFSGVTAPFYSATTTNQLTIEVAPVLGDLPSGTDETSGACGCTINRPLAQTNTVLTINSVIVNATPIVFPTAQINGGPYYYFSGSQTSGSGVINGNPGRTVNITLTANGPTSGQYNAQLTVSGATLSNGSNTLYVANGATTVSVVMPPSGSINWSATFTESGGSGGGAVNVSY